MNFVSVPGVSIQSSVMLDNAESSQKKSQFKSLTLGQDLSAGAPSYRVVKVGYHPQTQCTLAKSTVTDDVTLFIAKLSY